MSDQAHPIIDRQARDWLANLIERASALPPQPGDINAIDYRPALNSKDPIIADAVNAFQDFLNGRHQLNGAGTMPVVVNPEDQHRRIHNLITFLRSDQPY